MERLEQASREELIEIILRQQVDMALLLEQLESLQARVTGLEEEVRRLRRGGGSQGELSIKPSRPPREKQQRKHRGQAFVRRREVPDEVRHHAVECCPQCGRKLEGGWEHRRRQSIELVLHKRVVDHVIWARWCGVCQRRWLPELAPAGLGVQGKRRLGVSVQGLVATLHIGYRVPMKMIRRLLGELFGLAVSEGEVVELLEGVRAAGREELLRLHDEVRGSPVVCADETGWRQDGENGYLWGFFTPKVRWFLYRQTRSGQVPQEVLGKGFGGVVVSDFYAGYNRLEARHQRCWVHLIRDLKELAELNPDRPDTLAWVEAVVSLYRQAQALHDPRPRRRAQAQRHFQQRLGRLAQRYVNDDAAPQLGCTPRPGQIGP